MKMKSKYLNDLGFFDFYSNTSLDFLIYFFIRLIVIFNLFQSKLVSFYFIKNLIQWISNKMH